MRTLLTISALAVCILQTGCVKRSAYDTGVIVEEKYVHKYGLDVPEEEWVARGREGQVIKTLKNGVTVTENYRKGKKNGEFTTTFPRSSLIRKTEVYQDNELVAERNHTSTGAPIEEVRKDEHGDELHTTWYEEGAPKSVETIHNGRVIAGEYYMPANQLDTRVVAGEGIRNVRDEFGQLISADVVHEGYLSKSTAYHPNGNPKEIAQYREGKMHGTKKRFFPGGEPECVEEWSEGEQNGITTLYHHGEKYAEVPYVRGQKNGVEKRYREGGELAEEITWKNGRRHGPSVVYYGNNKEEIEWYFNGTPTTKVNFDLMNTFKPKKRA